MNPKITIGCPVRNRSWVLPDYLKALDAIDYPYKEYLFLINNSMDASKALLQRFIEKRSGTLRERNDDQPPGHRRGEYNANHYKYLASIRNFFIDLFLSVTSSDYLFSLDSDVIVPPDIITKLLPLVNDSTIAAAAISNIPGKLLDGHMPGNFMLNQNGVIRHPPKYETTGTGEFDVTGAVCLIPRKLFETGARYAPHRQGEDIPFCLDARQKGFRILVNFDVRCEHRMIAANKDLE